MKRVFSNKVPQVLLTTAIFAVVLAGWNVPLFAQMNAAVEKGVQASEEAVQESEVMLMESDLELEDAPEGSPAAGEAKTTYEKSEGVVPAEKVVVSLPDVPVVDVPVVDVPAVVEAPEVKGAVITEAEISKTSRALRQAIEQNKKLLEQNHQFEEQLRILRGQNRLDRNRTVSLEGQIEQLNTQTEDVGKVKERYDERINELSERMQNREKELNTRIQELEDEMKKQEVLAQEQKKFVSYEELGITKDELDSMEVPEDRIAQTLSPAASGLDVVSMLSDMEETQKQIKEDEARVHYNMGNIFFHQGEYEQAAAEYQKTLEFNPEDANAHFNLAFVAGDYLKDFPMAIKHYEKYLFLNPNADDLPLVNEKVLEAKLYVRSQVKGMRVEKDIKKDFGKQYSW